MIDDTIKKDKVVKEEEPKQEVEETVAKTTPVKEPDVVDVDLGFVEKRRFRIAGDYNRMLELNVSDLNIASRLNTGYPKLQKLCKDAHERIESISDDGDNLERLGEYADALTEIDTKMREIVDFIFDTNASEVCAPSGNMFDPVGGQWRFERIIEKLSALYLNGLDAEFNKIKNRVEKKTNKYTKKYHN